VAAAVALLLAMPARAADLVQVSQDFSGDPGWENMNNRVVASTDGPTITQNFGWRASSHFGGGGAPTGEVGGTIWRTRTPAHYAMKLPKLLSLNDPLSASGQIVVMPVERSNGGAYFGFFNSSRQGWRPWSSLAVRVGESHGTHPPTVDSHVDYMTGTWRAGGFQVGPIPADGKPHAWRLRYEPDMVVPKEWPDVPLRDALGTARRTEAELLVALRKDRAGLSEDELRRRLQAAADLGLIEFHTRRGVGWEARRNPERMKGKISYRFDDRPAAVFFLDGEHRAQAVEFDRFGLFNFQLPGRATEFYLADLVVNGARVDLSKDPGWEGRGNRTTFVERDFHAGHDFGFGKSNFAGKAAGEIGGTFWRTEAVDPIHGYYADDVGKLTLDDPISFSGSIAFTDGATDAGMFFGYFNREERLKTFTGAEDAAPMAQSMGITIDGPTRIGYNFSGQVAPTRATVGNIAGPIFMPDGRRHRFTFTYDPRANDNRGRITITLDDEHTFKHDLTREQRAAGSTFDRFGMMNVRRGGKYVTVYLDDLTYTARREAGAMPARHPQAVTKVPYPDGGRKY
jgi:hypothetical protein